MLHISSTSCTDYRVTMTYTMHTQINISTTTACSHLAMQKALYMFCMQFASLHNLQNALRDLA